MFEISRIVRNFASGSRRGSELGGALASNREQKGQVFTCLRGSGFGSAPFLFLVLAAHALFIMAPSTTASRPFDFHL